MPRFFRRFSFHSSFVSIALMGVALGGILLFAPAANAQIGVEAVLISKRVPVGDPAPMVLRVINGKPETLPEKIPVEGLSIIRSKRVERSVSSGTRGSRSEYHFYYYITGTKAGQYTIPPITVRIDGRDYTTEAVTLTLFKRDPNDPTLDATRPYFANLESPAKEVYAGQMAPFSLAVYVRGGRSINDMGPPVLRHDAIVFDYDRTYMLDGVDLDGNTFSTAKRPGSFFGLTPGTYTIGPAEVQVAMIDDTSPFGRLPGFFQSFVAKTLRTNALELTVKPLPEIGKPATFRGAVGKFSVSIKASPLAITVGDPVSLDFEVRGPGNYETLEAPVFLAEDTDGWRTYDARKIVDPAELSDGVKPGRATFNQIVMPQSQVTEIPAFELSFFNPETGAYESQLTKPIPLRVAPDPRRASAVAGGVAIPGNGENNATSPAGGGAYAIDAAATPEPSFNDIVHIRTTSPSWRPAPVAITRRPAFWAGQIVPAAGLLGLLGFALTRRIQSNKQGRANRRSAIPYSAALTAVEAAANRGEYYRAVLTALDSWSHEAGPAGEKNLPETSRAAREALRARSQWILYGATDEDRARPPEATETAESGQILEALQSHLS